MPLGLSNVQFLNQNSQRRYPLADTTSARDTTGAFRLPDDFVCELGFPVHAGEDVLPAQFFIKNVGAFGGGYSVVLGYQPAAGPAVAVATALVARPAHATNQVYALGGVGDFADSVGTLTVGTLDSIDLQPAGSWEFDFEATRLDPDAIRPIIRGVSALVCVNGTQRSVPLQGVVELRAGSNCQLIPVIESGQDPQIIINFLQGEGTLDDCVCTGDAALPPPITRIGGIAPTPAGDFYLVGDDCISLEPVANGLRLVDRCAAPCCGCPELEKVTRALTDLGQQASSVEGFVARLQSSVDTMSTIVLGARLGDQGCVPGG